MKTLAEQMNDDAYCNYCRVKTKTREWDCVKCGFSKGHPKEYVEQDIKQTIQAVNRNGDILLVPQVESFTITIGKDGVKENNGSETV